MKEIREEIGYGVEIDQVKEHLSDPRWRVENCYAIQNEAGL